MFERFTAKAIKVIMLAQEEARRMGHSFVGTEQILLGLTGEGSGLAAKALKSAGVNLADARKEVEKIIGLGTGAVAVEIPFTPRAKRLLELSWESARQLGHNYIGTEHLLLGLIQERDTMDVKEGVAEGVAAKVLEALGVNFDALRDTALQLVKEATALGPDAEGSALGTDPPSSIQELRATKMASNMGSIFSRFTEKAIKAVMLAQEEARRLGHNFVGTEQLLLGLIGEGTGIAAKTLKSLGVKLKDARVETEKIIGRGSGLVAVEIPFTPRAKRALELAWDEARQLGHKYIGTEHLLLGVIRGEGVATRVLENLSVDLSLVRNHVIRFLGESDNNATAGGAGSADERIADAGLQESLATGSSQSATPNVDEYCVNLTQAAEDDQWQTIVGRKREIDRIVQILGRLVKNNIILVGETGVGKTSMARGLATAVSSGDVPEGFLNQKIFMLNMAGLAVESHSQSHLEDLFKKIMNEIGKSGNSILIVDELQLLWQDSNLSKESLLAKIFKRELSSATFSFIGITNMEDYQKRIERDAILKNYCQPVIIKPTSVSETVQILRALRQRYEQYHEVSITDEALEQAANLSDRHISDRCLPDKAIDLLDEASSFVKQNASRLPAEFKKIKDELKKTKQDMERAIRAQQFAKAASEREMETKLSTQLQDLRAAWQASRKMEKPAVTAAAVAEVLNSWISN